MRASAVAAIAALACAILAGCATPSTSTGMTVHKLPIANRATEAVSITVTGGKQTSSTSVSQIADADFREALAASILESGLFPKIAAGNDAGYALEAFIGALDQPLIGFSLKVDMEVGYKLTDRSDGRIVWRKGIRSTHTATTSDSVIGATRLRLANEAAARKNIEAAITSMGTLQLR